MTGQSALKELGFIIRKDKHGYLWCHPKKEIEGDTYYATATEAIVACIDDCELDVPYPDH